jgi:hypothetical protein
MQYGKFERRRLLIGDQFDDDARRHRDEELAPQAPLRGSDRPSFGRRGADSGTIMTVFSSR